MPDPDSMVDMHFPKSGIDISMPFWNQPARPLPSGEYAKTTRSGVNVRTYDKLNRSRGGMRPGLSQYIAATVNGTNFIQQLDLLVGTGFPNPSGGAPVELSQSGRIVVIVAVSNGDVFVAAAGDPSWTATTNNSASSPSLNTTGVVYSAANQQKLYFADGTHYRFYNPITNSVETWLATQGSLPVDGSGNTPRLICTWRGRTVVSGLMFDAQNWFMSRVNVPTDFDYGPVSFSPAQAVAGNNSPLGMVGDVVTGLCPYNDDLLIFFGDHTIWIMRGDPMAGGQIDLVTDAIGGVWGVPWTKDPYGTVYFVSNRCGIYSLVPGQQPQRISQAIENLLTQIDTGANTIRLLWDDTFQGLHVFVTPTLAAAATTHFFWEMRSNAWWQDVYTDPNMNPLTCCTFDGNNPGDRVPLIGSWDGYVRAISPTATDDDGIPIASSVLIGPILSKDLDEMLCKDLQAVLGTGSGNVTFDIYLGRTAEGALASGSVRSGTWTAGRNLSTLIRRSAHAIYVKISATGGWSLEQVRARLAPQGKIRRRGY